jgi:hypothetical protein
VNEIYRHTEYPRTTGSLYWILAAYGGSAVILSAIARSIIPLLAYSIFVISYLLVSRGSNRIITVNENEIEFDDSRPVFYRMGYREGQIVGKVNLIFRPASEFSQGYSDFSTTYSDIIDTRIVDISTLPWFHYRWSNPTYYPSVTKSKLALILKSSSGYEFCIGTDDPEGLERAIRQALKARGQKLEQPNIENTV